MQIVPLTEEYAKELGLKGREGALVGGIMSDSPAAKGGVLVGDIILKVDNNKIKDFKDLVNTVSKTKIGKTLKIMVFRKKNKLNLFITVSERP